MSMNGSDRLIFDTQLKEERDYWIKRLSRELGDQNIPLDQKRSKVYSRKHAAVHLQLPEAVCQKLVKLTQNSPLLTYTALLATLDICLYKYTNAHPIVIGSPRMITAGTENEAANVIVTVVEVEQTMSFRQLLLGVRETLIEGYAKQNYPFERLVKDLGIEIPENRSAIFNIVMMFDGFHGPLPDLKNDITFRLSRDNECINVSIEYNARLFRKETIERFGNHFVTILGQGLENPDAPIHTLKILTPAETEQLLGQWNATTTDIDMSVCAHQLVEAQAEQTPDQVAVIFEGQQLTYGQLNQAANRRAHYLKQLGVGPEVRVGLCMGRSLEMVVSLLAVLKAGAAYVPLDPSYPQERLQFIIDDAAIAVVVTDSRSQEQLSAHIATMINIESMTELLNEQPATNPASGVNPDNPAYIIYTSGSTGVPKGVCMTHRPVVNLLQWQHAALAPAARTLQLTSLNFDVSFQEIFTTWGFGGTLVIASEAVRQNMGDLPTLLAVQGVERVFVPFVALQQLADLAQGQESLKLHQVITAGEQLQITPSIMKFFRQLDGCTLHNHYGPSETHVVTAFSLSGLPNHWPALPPIGRPIANTQIYILDAYQNLVPVGVVGELYIGGVALARGYHNRPALTAERFVANPFSTTPGERIYKTGDLARYLPDGNIEYVGRVDHQVKVRGYRVELGEIEAVLSQHANIRETVVVVREDEPGFKRLVAYVVAEQAAAATTDELNEFLREHLPAYMIPAVFMPIESLPLTASGKVDRRALPAPERTRADRRKQYVAPRSQAEHVLADIWADVLKLDQVGMLDNFFELGGDSILGMQVIARAKQMGLQLIPRQLFQYQTISALAKVASAAAPVEIDQGPVEGEVLLTPIQHWFVEQQLPDPQHYNMAVMLEARQALDAALMEQAVETLIKHHDALRLRLTRQDSTWRQHYADVSETKVFSYHDLSALPAAEHRQAIEALASELQTSLNLADGPIMRAAFMNLQPPAASRVLLIIHHIAVDGVSWRILLEDLETAYLQLSQTAAIQLPPKTTSFMDWANRLSKYAQSPLVAQEADYWRSKLWVKVSPLPRDYASAENENAESNARTVTVTFSPDETRALLQDVPAAYGAQIHEVLLTSLAQAVARWTGQQTVLINIEGHGREELAEPVDVSRTIGWFTTIVPALIDLEQTTTPWDALKLVKEQIRQIPHRGLHYGLLRYLSQDDALRQQLRELPQAEISFNYLGQFDQVADQSTLFRRAPEDVGPMVGPQNPRFCSIYVGGSVFNGQIQLEIVYSEKLYQAATIEAVARNLAESVRALIQHCLSPEAGSYTPSDFPKAKLSQQDLDTVLAQLQGISEEESE